MTYRKSLFPEPEPLPEGPISESAIEEDWDTYPPYDPPVFVGHYCAPPSEPRPIGNVICLDYSVAKGGFLTAYRWSPGKTISANNFVTVKSEVATGPQNSSV